MTNNSFEILVRDLKSLGLCRGDTVIVHSSLSAMGHVEGGAETVILALEDVIGEEGTLMFPTFTYADKTHRFSVSGSEVCVGKIPDTFRKMPGVIRSVNPTHSVGAWGRLANEITKEHYQDRTPFGDNSPYAKLDALGGKILMLGCSLLKMSYMHRIEEEAGAIYCLCDRKIDHEVTDSEGNTYVMEYTLGSRQACGGPEGRGHDCLWHQHLYDEREGLWYCCCYARGRQRGGCKVCSAGLH